MRMPSYFLAWKYLCARRGQTAIMLAGMTLALYLPLATHWLVDRFDRDIRARAEATPLVIGAKGSRFDLALHGLYFRARHNGTVPYSEYQRLHEQAAGSVIPLHSKFTAQNYPVVGTTVDYFHFRKLRLRQGDQMRQYGDCELGATVAAELGLGPGDQILTDRDNLFDLAGEYPLQLNVTAVLAPSGTPDDSAIFVDLETAWIIEGIGHGHNPDLDHNGTSPKLIKTHLEITPENVDSFHFHGDPDTFPLTALIARPQDDKAQALLLAGYQDHASLQALKAPNVMAELMNLQKLEKVQVRRRTFLLSQSALFRCHVLRENLLVQEGIKRGRKVMGMMEKSGRTDFSRFFSYFNVCSSFLLSYFPSLQLNHFINQQVLAGKRDVYPGSKGRKGLKSLSSRLVIT